VRTINQIQLALAGVKFPSSDLGGGRQLTNALTAFLVEATSMYRLGGFLGILLGVSASVLSCQIRRMGR
jgi:hypothetical protein